MSEDIFIDMLEDDDEPADQKLAAAPGAACGCYHTNNRDCGASDGGYWLCTLEPGHDGDHVACGSLDHRVHVWQNDQALAREARSAS